MVGKEVVTEVVRGGGRPGCGLFPNLVRDV